MLGASYRKRLDADLVRWVAEGVVPPATATAIRQAAGRESGFALPALLGLFGGLLIASSLAAFVAANWEEMPRLMRLALVISAVLGSFALAARFEAKGSRLAAEGAATCGVLCFGIGVALVGQMYHLPADWPAGALLVALGALAAAVLMRSDGALLVALVGAVVWMLGRWSETKGAPQPLFLLVLVPCLWLAAFRTRRMVHHAAVLALGVFLASLPGDWWDGRFDYGLIAYALAVSVVYVLAGAWALDRGGPPLLDACLPWGLIGLTLSVDVELLRILDSSQGRAGTASWFVFAAYAVALPGTIAFAVLARERRFALALAAALLIALALPVVYWSGIGVHIVGRIIVSALVLGCAIALVLAGAAGGIRRMTLAGSGLFGLAILILLWQTVGTLLDQSLFFLVAGAALLSLAGGTRKLLARFAKPAAGAAP